GPLRRQPLVGTDGRRARGGGAPAWSRGDAPRGQPRGFRPRRGGSRRDADRGRARAGSARSRRRCRRRGHGRGRCRLPPSPASRAAKRPKDTATWTLELEPTTDVLSELGEHRREGQILVGFAAETGAAGLERAREKLSRKGADLFVLNDVSRTDIGFDTYEN